jgi:hypothetical protein
MMLIPISTPATAVLEDLPSSTGVDEGIKKQLLAEMKFMRAFFYFYLVNLFGDVPLTTTTDYRVNRVLARTPKRRYTHSLCRT